MTGTELVHAVDAAGGVLTLKGGRIQYQLPRSAAILLEQLRQHRKEVLQVLREQQGASQFAATLHRQVKRLFQWLTIGGLK
jgi:hypothetical protein